MVSKEDPLNIGGWTCPRCGSTNRNETVVCSVCGADLQQVMETRHLPEDSEITKIIADLAGKLDIENYPRSMLWRSSFWISRYGITIERPETPILRQPPKEIKIDPTYPVIVEEAMLVSPILQGRGLSPQELATLIAGPLINLTKLRWAHISSGLPKVVAGFVCLILMFTGIGPIPSIFYVQSTLSFAWTLGLVAIMVLIGISVGRFNKKTMFLADSMAAGLLGRDVVLGAFNRLESLRQSDERSNVKWHMSNRRSLQKRIDHLNDECPVARDTGPTFDYYATASILV